MTNSFTVIMLASFFIYMASHHFFASLPLSFFLPFYLTFFLSFYLLFYIPLSGEMGLGALGHVTHTLTQRSLERGGALPSILLPGNVDMLVALFSLVAQWQSVRTNGKSTCCLILMISSPSLLFKMPSYTCI